MGNRGRTAAYPDRGLFVADPDYAELPTQTLISPTYADAGRRMIDPHRVLSPLPPSPLPSQQSTVYVTIVDQQRNACSLINTLFYGFGSGIMMPDSGIVLHNRGYGFVVQPGHPNDIQPYKRPLHNNYPGHG